jgi:hypothetical protein
MGRFEASTPLRQLLTKSGVTAQTVVAAAKELG